jgi:HSP20 family protein
MAGLVPFGQRHFPPVFQGLDDLFTDPWSSLKGWQNTFRVDVRETEDAYSVEAELPGIKKDEVNVELTDGRLWITVNRQTEKDEQKTNYVHRERQYSSMRRALYLADARPEGITAPWKRAF